MNYFSDYIIILIVFDTYSGRSLSSVIMTTMGFIVNLAFQMLTFNMDIRLCRRIYDPGGVHFYLNIYHYTSSLVWLYCSSLMSQRNMIYVASSVLCVSISN